MSIQAECREAMNRLADRGVIFTEIDVANEASTESWSSKNFEAAVRHAYNVLQGDYKLGRLVRYGPVKFNGVGDYARRATKIVYAHPQKGPRNFETPNGRFPRLLASQDSMMTAGRRTGTNRDDTKPWSAQNVSTKKVGLKGPPVDTAPLLRRIQELERENAALRKPSADAPADEASNISLRQLLDMLAGSPEFKETVKTTVAEALIS